MSILGLQQNKKKTDFEKQYKIDRLCMSAHNLEGYPVIFRQIFTHQ